MHDGATEGEDPKLYVVATPLGNLGDITLRALQVLGAVDVIAAEDTRVTHKLLQHHGIHTRLIAAHEHNERSAAARIVALLREGKQVALVTDAGTPGFSDPGAEVVAAVRAAGLAVTPIPGANAAVAALSASGRVTDRVLFCGFLPARAAARRKALETLRALPFTLVFYEAPHRVRETLIDLRDALGPERTVTLARELTKRFEAFHSCPLAQAEAWVAADPNRERGEFVLLVDGAEVERAAEAEEKSAERVLQVLLAELPLKQAVALTTTITGANRNRLYARALALRSDAS
ncbi:MAG: 16S rRNA (cytidine(1402)-2'-O)-methyltransferase [Burkholderiales bacterium]